MNKLEIRKKILKLRKQNYSRNLKVNFKHILKILKKNKTIGRVVGGYYPYNYEMDVLKILENFEKKNYQISLPKVKKKLSNGFFSMVNKRSS